MKGHPIALLVAGMMLVFAAALNAGSLENQGRAWLDAQKEPAAINVNGSWKSEEFGSIHLRQDATSRDVNGVAGSYELTGVVSGKHLYLLFTTGSTVEYCAVLTSENDGSMDGSYSNRVSRLKHGRGLCQASSRPMYMSKK